MASFLRSLPPKSKEVPFSSLQSANTSGFVLLPHLTLIVQEGPSLLGNRWPMRTVHEPKKPASKKPAATPKCPASFPCLFYGSSDVL